MKTRFCLNIRHLQIKTHYSINRRFISHYKTESWGSSILIMEKRGKAFGRIYWYNDDNIMVYLDCLSVNAEIQRQGIGTKLQKIREEIGRSLGAITACLWVQKNTWMYDWYKRRGYEDWINNENEENAIWMKKSLADE